MLRITVGGLLVAIALLLASSHGPPDAVRAEAAATRAPHIDTRTPTNTRTPLPTRTATRTRTPSPTRRATSTRTPTSTRGATATRTPSLTRSPTSTRGATATRTPTSTRSATLTRPPSPTRTATPTRTVAPTRTPSATRAASPTRTPTSTRGATATRTATATRGATATRTPSPTRTTPPTPADNATIVGQTIGDYDFRPLAGVTVTLRRQSGTVASTTTTDAEGNFLFSVPAGDYRISTSGLGTYCLKADDLDADPVAPDEVYDAGLFLLYCSNVLQVTTLPETDVTVTGVNHFGEEILDEQNSGDGSLPVVVVFGYGESPVRVTVSKPGCTDRSATVTPKPMGPTGSPLPITLRPVC